MKTIGFWLGLYTALLSPCLAQVTVEVVQDQDQFLPGEAIPTKVRITNRSGQTLRLGAQEDWLEFVVQTREGGLVSKTAEVPVVGEFTLESSKVATKRVDLAPCFAVSRPGRYGIVASVRVKEWDRQFTSPPRNFDTIEGAKLWEQEVGVPGTAGGNNPPEVRKYILQEANYLKTHLQLYLRVTDVSGARVFKVCPIGPMVSFSRPEPQVDQSSNLHVLYQSGPRFFTYTVFNPEGEIIVRQAYEYANTRPRLRAEADGNIVVNGGTRHLTAYDVPPSNLTPPSEDAPKPDASPGEKPTPKS